MFLDGAPRRMGMLWHGHMTIIGVVASEIPLLWRHNERNGVSNHRRLYCLLNHLFGRRSKKTTMIHVTGLSERYSPVTGGSPHKGPATRKTFPFDDVIIVRRAGLIWTHEDPEMWWSVPFTCAWLYMSVLLFCLICVYSSHFSISFWIMYSL